MNEQMFPWVGVAVLAVAVLGGVYWADYGRAAIGKFLAVAFMGLVVWGVGHALMHLTAGHAVPRVLVCVAMPVGVISVPLMRATGDYRVALFASRVGLVLAVVAVVLALVGVSLALGGVA